MPLCPYNVKMHKELPYHAKVKEVEEKKRGLNLGPSSQRYVQDEHFYRTTGPSGLSNVM